MQHRSSAKRSMVIDTTTGVASTDVSTSTDGSSANETSIITDDDRCDVFRRLDAASKASTESIQKLTAEYLPKHVWDRASVKTSLKESDR